jgi:hypothetical protein
LFLILLASVGHGASVYAVGSWGAQHFGDLDPVKAVRLMVPAVFSLTLGAQIVLSSFFLSVLPLGQAPEPVEASERILTGSQSSSPTGWEGAEFG